MRDVTLETLIALHAVELLNSIAAGIKSFSDVVFAVQATKDKLTHSGTTAFAVDLVIIAVDLVLFRFAFYFLSSFHSFLLSCVCTDCMGDVLCGYTTLCCVYITLSGLHLFVGYV